MSPPAGTLQRARLQQWLGFIGTELHKAVFIPLLDPHAPEEVKRYAREKVGLRMGMLQKQLAANDYLLDGFSVADAYLFTVLRWSSRVDIDVAKWPNLKAYMDRVGARPKVQAAMKAEGLIS